MEARCEAVLGSISFRLVRRDQMSPVVVFDIGSTLIHPNFSVLSAWVAGKTGVDVAAPIAEKSFRRALADDIFSSIDNHEAQAERFFSLCGCKADQSHRWSTWWGEVVEAGGVDSWLYTVLDVEAKATLGCLQDRGFRLIAASNSDGTLDAELAAFGLREFFEETYDSENIGVQKPSFEFYATVLRSSAGQFCVHVGDDLTNDLVGALSSGFQRALLYDPADIYLGLTSQLRIRRLSEIVSALALPS